jgi:hypothetical protein
VDREKLTETLGIGCLGLIVLWALLFGGLFLVSFLAKPQIRHVINLKPFLASCGLWAGATAGILTAIDWITPVQRKTRLKEILVSVWVWLAEQKAGRFTILLFKESAQRVFALLSHAILVFFPSTSCWQTCRAF